MKTNEERPETRNVEPSARESSLIERARKCLDDGAPEEAYSVVASRFGGSGELQNLAAVCLMRMGRAHEAVDILRNLLVPHGGITMANDLPAKYQANFALALLLSGNLGGCLKVLREIGDSPAAGRLNEVIDAWRKDLGRWQRIMLVMGSTPRNMPEVGPSPGEP